MSLRVSGKNLDIGESLRRHVLEKVESMVGRYYNGAVSGHIVIAREGSGYRSDCSLLLSSGVGLQAEGKAHEPYPCFEQAADKIEARLRRYKRRLKGHSGAAEAPGAASAGAVLNYVVTPPENDEEEPAEGFNPVVVAEGTETLKSLSVASAVAELDLAGESDRAIAITPGQVDNFRRLIAEAESLFGGAPYQAYHLLLCLSDLLAHYTLEHSSSSDNRFVADALYASRKFVTTASTIPHEYVHVWNGKARTPIGLAT